MLKYLLLTGILLSHSLIALSQTEEVEVDDIQVLKRKVQDLEEVQNENSQIIKRQLADLHFDQSSRGYLELKFGLSHFKPDDLEDENDELFTGLDDSSWKSFEKANIIEIEIGKSILINESVKNEFGIGYQNLSSKMTGSFFPDNNSGKITVREKVSIHTIYARYAMMMKANSNGKLWLGPGITVGYSPITELKFEIEQGIEGAQMTGEGTSYLFEVFGKGKLEISRYFTLIATAGYRVQEADDLRLNAAELVTVKTTTNLDASGFFATVGLGVSF